MREQDLQKVGLMVCAIVFLLAPKLPEASFWLAILMWPIVLAFDGIDNRGRMV